MSLGRPRLPRQLAATAAIVGLCLLSGCHSLPFFQPKKTAATCPAAVVLRPLANTATFTKPDLGMTPTDVVFYGILSEVDARCNVTSDTLHADLDVIIAAQRGPATQGESVTLPYFIAVVGPNQTIVSKRSFQVAVNVPHDAKRGGITDHIEEAIPLGGRAPDDLQIVVGFQQTPQVVDFYRHFRGR